jgi:hypothetical protein
MKKITQTKAGIVKIYSAGIVMQPTVKVKAQFFFTFVCSQSLQMKWSSWSASLDGWLPSKE